MEDFNGASFRGFVVPFGFEWFWLQDLTSSGETLGDECTLLETGRFFSSITVSSSSKFCERKK